MEAYRKIREVQSFIKIRDDNGEKTHYSISAYKNETIYDVIKDGSGADNCENDILKAIESLKPEKIIVVAYGATPGKNAKQIGKWEIAFQQSSPGQITVAMPQMVNHPKPKAEFDGFGGIEGYLGFHKQVMDLEFDKRMMQFDIENLQKEKSQLAAKVSELEAELADLDNENEELNGVNQQLEKFVPGNFRIFGMDGTKLLGALATNVLDTYIKRNPVAISKLTGLDAKTLAGLVGTDNQESESSGTETEANFKPSGDASEREQATEQTQIWLNGLSDDEFEKNFSIIVYIYQNPDKVLEIIEFIKTLK